MGHAALQAGDIAGADASAHIVQEVCNPAHLPSCASCIVLHGHSRLQGAGLLLWARAPVLKPACPQSTHNLYTVCDVSAASACRDFWRACLDGPARNLRQHLLCTALMAVTLGSKLGIRNHYIATFVCFNWA